MELRAAIEKRATVWEFTSEPVRIEDLRAMVELAGRAPSVNNAQPWRYIAVLDPVLKHAMVRAVKAQLEALLPPEASEQERETLHRLCVYCTVFDNAPAVLAVLTRSYEGIVDWVLARAELSHEDARALRGHPDIVSLGASIENLLLTATDLGYASCWMTGPLVARRQLEGVLGVEPPWSLGALLAIGKAGAPRAQSDKKSVDEILEVRG